MKFLKISNTLAYLAMVLINFLADTIPFGGKTTAEISAAYPTMITPIGFTFIIWAVIYLFMGTFILYQWGVFGDPEESNRLVHKMNILFLTSCLLNIAWLICWHEEAIGLSVICIAALLLNLIAINSVTRSESDSFLKRLTVNTGFQLYYGWIVLATLVNISAWLVQIEWNRFGLSAEFWTVEVLLLGTALGAVIVILGKYRSVGLAMVWGYIGILLKHASATGYNLQHPFIVAVILIGIFVLLLAVVLMTSLIPAHPKEVHI